MIVEHGDWTLQSLTEQSDHDYAITYGPVRLTFDYGFYRDGTLFLYPGCQSTLTNVPDEIVNALERDDALRS